MKNQKRDKHLSKRSGFTLIEVILVVVIISILGGIVVPRMGGRTESANLVQAQSNIDSLGSAIQLFEITNGSYPSSLDELLDESKGGPFMEKKSIPTDPWGNPFSYATPGAHNSHSYDLSCTSPKGKSVNNWE